MLEKTKISIGNLIYPPFVWCAKQIFNSLVNKCNISSDGHIPNKDDNNTIMDPLQENNSNHTIDEGYIEVVESTTVISIVDTVDHLKENVSDAPANLNEQLTMVIKSIPSSKKASRKNWAHDNGDTDSNSAPQILEMI